VERGVGMNKLGEGATPRQKVLITRLCMKLKIRDRLENLPLSKGEAGRLIRRLQSGVGLIDDSRDTSVHRG